VILRPCGDLAGACDLVGPCTRSQDIRQKSDEVMCCIKIWPKF
jgi:hypothetical protein